MATPVNRAAEKRIHKRFIVSGSAEIELAGIKAFGRVASIGAGGLLVYCELTPFLDAEIRIEFSVLGFAGECPVTARGKVVWTQPGKMGVEFLKDPTGLKTLLMWLEHEHYVWSGTV
jgi:hypothetical protein